MHTIDSTIHYNANSKSNRSTFMPSNSYSAPC